MSESLLLLSSSYIYSMKTNLLGYCRNELNTFLQGRKRLLFVPYAYPDHEEYTAKVRNALNGMVTVTGAHTLRSISDVTQYDVVFCGGGNTFLLLTALYDTGLLDAIRAAVGRGVAYIGSSAGANVACPTIGTTNDMPIACPPSFTALGLVPFNINPHYYERPRGWPHMDETKRERIREFQRCQRRTVLALREGAMLILRDGILMLEGQSDGLLFMPDNLTRDGERAIAPGTDLSFLLKMEGAGR